MIPVVKETASIPQIGFTPLKGANNGVKIRFKMRLIVSSIAQTDLMNQVDQAKGENSAFHLAKSNHN